MQKNYDDVWIVFRIANSKFITIVRVGFSEKLKDDINLGILYSNKLNSWAMQSTVQNHLGYNTHQRFTNLVFFNQWLSFNSNKTI